MAVFVKRVVIVVLKLIVYCCILFLKKSRVKICLVFLNLFCSVLPDKQQPEEEESHLENGECANIQGESLTSAGEASESSCITTSMAHSLVINHEESSFQVLVPPHSSSSISLLPPESTTIVHHNSLQQINPSSIKQTIK